jgi:hypothetical protein
MNTQVPFTEIDWSFGAPRKTSEQTFRVRYSQNLNRYLNFGLIYDIVYSLGQYSYQKAEDKTFTFFSSYTGKKYKLYFATGINNLMAQENGGVADMSELAPNLDETRNVPVRLGSLSKAKNIIKNRNLVIVQKYIVGSNVSTSDTTRAKGGFLSGLKGTFTHAFTWEKNKCSYIDNYPQSGFYDTSYISSSVTSDSLFSRIIKNTIRFDFTTDESRKFKLGGGVGVRNELARYGQKIPTHDVNLFDITGSDKHNNILLGKLFNNIGENFRWSANGELFLSGYRAGDFLLNGVITKSFEWKKGMASWDITGAMINRSPSFWQQRWGSNNFEWNSNLKKEFRMEAGTRFSYPARQAEIKFNYAIIDNYTDFDNLALPSSREGGLSVIAVSARKEFRIWKFHLATDILAQESSNRNILDLPALSTRAAAYIEHLFRFKQTNGRLDTQFGADLTYHTLYYPYSYMPATGRFYRQDQVKAGNYPFINVFLNLKLKRTRIFIMYDHVNSGSMGYNYYMIPYYPQNIRMIRYGLSWTFYN